ncbi:EamA family transporter [Chloroflexota bacterium]
MIKHALRAFFYFERIKLNKKVWIALAIIYIIWGSTYLAIRFAVESIPPFLMAATRFLIPGLILYGWRRISGDRNPTRIEWRSTIIIGLLLLLGGNGAVTWAERSVPSGIAALVVGSVPLWIIILNLFTPEGRQQDKKVILGAFIGFLGLFVLIGPSQILGFKGIFHPMGVAALLLAAFFWSAGSLFSRSAVMPDSPLLSTGMEFLAGGLGLLITGAIAGEFSQLSISEISLRSYLSLAYLMVFGSLIAFVAYTWLLRNAPITLVSTYAYVNPIIAILLGNLLADEIINSRIIIAAIIIISSVFFINRSSIINQSHLNKISIDADENHK